MHKSWLYQILCALNLAMVIVSIWGERGGSPAFLGKLAYPAYTYLFPLLRRLYHDSSFERNCVLYSMSLLLATIIFLLMLVLRYFSRLRSFILISAGGVSVAAYPISCLWSQWHLLRISPAAALGLLLEILTVVVSAILYLHRRWPIPQRPTIVLLAMHFGLWAWVSGNFGVALDIARGPSYSGSWTVIFNALFLPVLGFLASISWAYHTRSTATADTLAMTHAERAPS